MVTKGGLVLGGLDRRAFDTRDGRGNLYAFTSANPMTYAPITGAGPGAERSWRLPGRHA